MLRGWRAVPPKPPDVRPITKTIVEALHRNGAHCEVDDAAPSVIHAWHNAWDGVVDLVVLPRDIDDESPRGDQFVHDTNVRGYRGSAPSL